MFQDLSRRSLPLLACAFTFSACGERSGLQSERGGVGTSHREIVVREGETQPAYDFSSAVRELVFVEAPIDSDGDGDLDRIAVDILRPRESDGGLRVATLMEASPYYAVGLQGVRGSLRIPRGFNTWYAEYFVPRGYAVVEVEMQGTSRSSGCPTSGGKEDTASIVAAIDWLNGRAKGFHRDGTEAFATWSTGSVGMIGVSYNGTLPIAVAAQGTPGLKTVVPIAAISSWYDYARDQGIAYSGWDERYPEALAGYVVSNEARQRCAGVLQQLGDEAGDESADYTAFWRERDYRATADRMQASVLLVHGQEDWNVKPHNFSRFWYLAQARDLPRKLWLHRDGHLDPVSIRRDEWRDLLHHWLDHWLYEVDNGVMEKEPLFTVQRPDGRWEAHDSWPAADAVPTTLYLGAPTGGPTGSLNRTSDTSEAKQSFLDNTLLSEDVLLTLPELAQPNRLTYATPALTAAVRLSGTPRVRLHVAAGTVSTPLTALLVDYGSTQTFLPRSFSMQELLSLSCTLKDLENRTGCAAPLPELPLVTQARLVTKGSIDLKNRGSIESASAVIPGESYQVEWELHPKDYVFPVGHRIGVVLTANDTDYVAVDARAGLVTVSLKDSGLVLPLAPVGNP